MNRPLPGFLGVFLGGLLLTASLRAGEVLRVGKTQVHKTPSAAAAVARDGDTVEIEAGNYPGDVALWTASHLTIRGVGGKARLAAAGRSCQGKAIWVVRGDDTSIENVDFSGCHVADRNGAGIRLEGAGLELRSCGFHDNENGLLTGADPRSDILIEECEFNGNGAGDGQSHNLYVGRVRKLTMRRCWSRRARTGHLVKSRAETTILEACRFTDEADGASSYLVDLPDAGRCTLSGNILQHGPKAQNRVAVSYGEESFTNAGRELTVAGNTYVNERAAGGDFVSVGVGGGASGDGSGCLVRVADNLIVGSSSPLKWRAGEVSHNLMADLSVFADAARSDYRLREGSPMAGAGMDRN